MFLTATGTLIGVLTKELDGFEEIGAISFNLLKFDACVVQHNKIITFKHKTYRMLSMGDLLLKIYKKLTDK